MDLDGRSGRTEPAVGTGDFRDRAEILELVHTKLRAMQAAQSCADCEGDGAKPCRAEDGGVVWRCPPCQARRQRLTPPKPPTDPDPDWGSYV